MIPCKVHHKISSTLLKTSHHETPTTVSPAEWWWKSTLTRKDRQQSRKPHRVTFQRTEKKSTQDGHSSFNLRWLAEWKWGGWCEKSEGSRALMFKSFLYDKRAALLEPVKRKEEPCREERGSCSTLPWRTNSDLGTRHTRAYDKAWKLTLQTGLVTHQYHADVRLKNLNSGPNLGWNSFCFHASLIKASIILGLTPQKFKEWYFQHESVIRSRQS